MYKLFRFYNQNRIGIWVMIIAIVFIIAIIQVLNSAVIEEKKANLNKGEETTFNNVVSYDKQSESIISSGGVSETYKDEFGQTIDRFFTYCINHEIGKAYDMISTNMKNIKYPTQKLFEEGYYKNKFEGNKQYSFKSWSVASERYVYIVNIFDNMLATGKTNKSEYIEEYITIIPEGDTYKINLEGYIGRENINRQNFNSILQVQIPYSDKYMNYEIYTLNIKNNSDKTIMIDTKENTKNTYLLDENGNKYDALIHENKDEDLILKPKEAKTIKVKFSNIYNFRQDIQSIEFTKIVDYNEYLTNKNAKLESLRIEI